VNSFEEILASYCDVNNAAVLSSGTAAIHLALIMLGVQPGDEVIASTFTFSATVNPIVYLGATPVLVDSENDTWNMDAELLEKAIRDRIRKGKRKNLKAIIIVHLYGMPANMKAIMEVADKYEIPVIEDAAEALGSRFQNRPLGSFGEMSVLSFNGNKIITTSGGGALLSNNGEYIQKARFLATQARDRAPHYQHSEIGYNYRMSNVLAGIGIGQMEVIKERVQQRRDNYVFYRRILEDIPGITFTEEPGPEYYSNRWLTTILIDNKKTGISREELQGEFEKENIESRPLWKPMHLQPVFKDHPVYLSGTSENLFKIGLCLPSGSNMTTNDRERIVKVLQRCLIK
jgi:dTDP-4-amino-4,6-dideoxygalactose transaminase